MITILAHLADELIELVNSMLCLFMYLLAVQ